MTDDGFASNDTEPPLFAVGDRVSNMEETVGGKITAVHEDPEGEHEYDVEWDDGMVQKHEAEAAFAEYWQ